MLDHQRFFNALGLRVRELREARGYTLEDMISYGFSARHWQQIEKGRPVTVMTLLRVCHTFGIRIDDLVRSLDEGIYQEPLRRS